MTTDELNTIVAAVVAELEKSGVDFDYKAEQAENDDLVFVIRGTAPNYQGVTVTWKGLLDIITAQATQAKNDAETAKNAADTILKQVQSKGTEITNFVATSKTEIETQKNESVNAVKSVYQTDLNELKGDLINIQACTSVTANQSVGADNTDITNDSGYVTSEYIDIGNHLDGKMIKFKCYLRSWRGFAFSDKDKVGISGLNGNDAASYGYVNATLNEIKIAIPADAKYLRITRSTSDGYSTPSDIKVEYFKTKYNDDDIKELVQETDIDYQYTVTTVSGKYIGATGSLNREATFSITNPILISAGKTINFKGSGSSTNVAMISKYTNGTYTPLVISDGNNYKWYTYTATEDIYAVFSFRNSYGYELSVTKNLIDAVKDTEELTEAIPQLQADVADISQRVGINYTTILKNMAGIGDSLMSGEIYDDDNNAHADCYNYSWLSLLSDLNNAKWECFSQGGLTTKGWLESHWKTDFEALSELPDSVFIGLGSNDKNNTGTIPTGTASDTSSDTTFCGYYKRIIELVHTKCPNAKVYCCSLYTTSSAEQAYSALIEDISEQYSYTYYIDIANNLTINVKATDVYAENSHFSTVGYLVVADTIFRLLNSSIYDNLIDYKYFGLYNNM